MFPLRNLAPAAGRVLLTATMPRVARLSQYADGPRGRDIVACPFGRADRFNEARRGSPGSGRTGDSSMAPACRLASMRPDMGCRDRTRSTVQYGTKTMETPSIAEPLRGARNGAR